MVVLAHEIPSLAEAAKAYREASEKVSRISGKREQMRIAYNALEREHTEALDEMNDAHERLLAAAERGSWAP